MAFFNNIIRRKKIALPNNQNVFKMACAIRNEAHLPPLSFARNSHNL
jgi:hypothetical protein